MTDPRPRVGPLRALGMLLPPDTRGDEHAPAHEPLVIVLTAGLCLTLLEYLGSGGSLFAGRMGELAWWALACVVCYALVPLCVWKFALGRRVVDLGLRLGKSAQHWGIYLAMAALMAPIVVLMSMTDRFQQQYPFLRPVDGVIALGDLLAWELMYAAQFVALEIFFRGFLTLGLERRLGGAAVWVMVLPYCMIHFGKPMPETLAAIVAGVALGSLALRTRSVLPGAALHIAVAWSMDAAALWRTGATVA